MYDDLSTDRTIRNEEEIQEMIPPRTKSRASRPNSSAKRKIPVTSRPNSVALFQHPLFVSLSLSLHYYILSLVL